LLAVEGSTPSSPISHRRGLVIATLPQLAQRISRLDEMKNLIEFAPNGVSIQTREPTVAGSNPADRQQWRS
jgi:hypothetical protein